jgi:uncharacterized membrane protein YbhN (UPF0104 family)
VVAPPSRRAWAKNALRWAFGILPLVWIGRSIDLSEVLAKLGAVGLVGLAEAWGLLLAGLLLGAERWRLLAAAYGGRDVPGVITLTRHMLVGAYFNLLPGGVAGEAVRAIRMKPFVGDLVTSFNILVVERIVGLVGLLALAAVAMSRLSPASQTIVVRCLEAGVALALVLAAVAILVPYRVARSPMLRERLAQVPLAGPLLLKLPPAQRPSLLGVSVVLSLATQALAITSLLTITRAIDAGAPQAIVAVLPLIVLVTHVPLAPGGIGQREGAFVYFYGLIGVSAALALGTSVVMFLVSLSFGAAGGICYAVEGVLERRDR